MTLQLFIDLGQSVCIVLLAGSALNLLRTIDRLKARLEANEHELCGLIIKDRAK